MAEEKCVDVVIIGGGLAGLAAAAHLSTHAPHLSVLLLEARPRLGGRTHTVQGIDLGASWISTSEGNSVRDIADAAGLPLTPSDTHDTLLFTQHGPLPHRAPLDAAWEHAQAHVAAASAALRAACAPAAPSDGPSLAQLLDGAVGSLEDGSLAPLVRARAEAHWGTLYAAGLQRISGAHYCEPPGEGSDEVLIGPGFSAVVGLLAAKAARCEVRLSTAVAEVQWGGRDGAARGVQLRLCSTAAAPPQGGEGCGCAPQPRVAARAVICTVPLGLLKASVAAAAAAAAGAAPPPPAADAPAASRPPLLFSPPLPPPVASAIEKLGWGTLNKACLVFESDPLLVPQPSPPAACLEFLPSAPSSPPAAFPYLLQQLLPNGAVAVVGLCVPNASGGGAVRGSEGACEALLAQLRVMAGGKELPRVREQLVADWGREEWSMGSYSFMGLGARPSDRVTLQEPLGGRLWLAGEHTQLVGSGYTHGAVDSGVRAAVGVLGHLEGGGLGADECLP